jgi:hypothetical protein
MNSLAVLICMAAKADHELALRAISSTSAAMRPGDRMFLHVDGAEACAENAFRAACASVPIDFFYSRYQIGLAAGLNKLIDAGMTFPDLCYFARMDADDECLPERLDLQRAFFAADESVDILGGRCRECDENGENLRTKKLPGTHSEIVSHLPRRNPINHPTVMIRRRVFESGLRYRTDVGLVEDWQLWVDAAAAGFRLANLNEVVLNFRRSKDFFGKRGGWKTATAEWGVRRHARKALHKSSVANFCFAAAASGLRLMPARIQAAVYRALN